MEFISLFSMRWTISSHPLNRPLNISWLGNQQLSCLRFPFYVILHTCNIFLCWFRLHFPMVPCPSIIPPCTFLNILCPIQDPSPLLIENPMQSRLWWHTRLTTLCGGTPVTNERSLSDCTGPEAQPKVVLLLPRSEPSATLGSIPMLTNWRCCRRRVDDHP